MKEDQNQTSVNIMRKRLGYKDHVPDATVIARYKMMLEPWGGDYEKYIKEINKYQTNFDADKD
jgi:hypothetical protein